MSDSYVLERLEMLCRRVDALEKHEHEPGYHEHLMDPDELAHHLAQRKPKHPLTRRAGERRAGSERRVSTDKYEGEERRA